MAAANTAGAVLAAAATVASSAILLSYVFLSNHRSKLPWKRSRTNPRSNRRSGLVAAVGGTPVIRINSLSDATGCEVMLSAFTKITSLFSVSVEISIKNVGRKPFGSFVNLGGFFLLLFLRFWGKPSFWTLGEASKTVWPLKSLKRWWSYLLFPWKYSFFLRVIVSIFERKREIRSKNATLLTQQAFCLSRVVLNFFLIK